MSVFFYIAACIAVSASIVAITRLHVIHAILFLIVSFLAIAFVFYSLGAHFIAGLEVITYAGAVMVLFMFAVLLLNLGASAVEKEKKWQPPALWAAPAVVGAFLIAFLAWALTAGAAASRPALAIEPATTGAALFGPYWGGVLLSAFLLLAGLLGAYHLGRPSGGSNGREGENHDGNTP